MTDEQRPTMPGQAPFVPSKGTVKAHELYELRRCRECGRVLHNKESQERGFGPTCGLVFAHLWIKGHPKYVATEVQKRWTREEVNALLIAARIPPTKPVKP